MQRSASADGLLGRNSGTLGRVHVGGNALALTRPFQAGQLTFFVASPEQTLVSLAEQLFLDLPTGVPTAETPCFTLTQTSEHPARYELTGPVFGKLGDATLSKALAWTVAAVTRAALDAEPERLHLHAAAAVKDGKGVILAAPRGTGKTTALARLVLDGWDYVSDEMVALDRNDARVFGFPKPLSVKSGSRPLLPDLSPRYVSFEDADDSAVLHVNASAIAATSAGSVVPHLVLLLSRNASNTPGHRTQSRPLHPVDAVVGLMAETLDATRYGPDAFLELARLAARCRCHAVEVGTPESTTAEIDRLFGQPAAEPLHIEDFAGGAHMHADTRTLLIGDRVVVHEQPAGRILAFDASASRIWMTLGGWNGAEPVDLAAPVIAPFVEHLAEIGMLLQGRT